MPDYVIKRDDSLQHHGIKGQKWGVRRYENEDGTLTDAGKIRYAKAQRDASQYQTAKDRLKKIGRAARTGLAAGAAMTNALALRNGFDSHFSGNILMKSVKAIQNNPVGYIGWYAIPTLAAASASSLKQGYEAAKVKRGQNFIKKYEAAYKKTQRQELGMAPTKEGDS